MIRYDDYVATESLYYAGTKSAADVGKSKSSCACSAEKNPTCAVVGLEMLDYDNPCLAKCEYVPVSVCLSISHPLDSLPFLSPFPSPIKTS